MPPNPTCRRHPAARLGLAAALALAGAMPPAAAQDNAQAAQVRAMQQRLRSAEQAKAQLAQQKAELDQQLKSNSEQLGQTQRQAEAAERKRASLARELDGLRAEKTALADKLAALEAQLAEARNQGASTQAALMQRTAQAGRCEAEKRQQGETLGQRTQALDACTTKNEHLYRVGAHLLGQYVASSGGLLAGEPVTGLARVAVENRAEELRDQLDAQRLAAQKAFEDQQRAAALKKLAGERLAQAGGANANDAQGQGISTANAAAWLGAPLWAPTQARPATSAAAGGAKGRSRQRAEREGSGSRLWAFLQNSEW